MQTKEDRSCGVIPLYKNGDQWEVFLINQYGSGGDVYWTFPKGHPEGNESEKECALRELYEETHITIETLHEDKVYTQEYSFKYGDTLVHKSVLYFIGETMQKTFVIQEDEVKEAGWFSCREAEALLTYEPARAMFKEVLTDRDCV